MPLLAEKSRLGQKVVVRRRRRRRNNLSRGLRWENRKRSRRSSYGRVLYNYHRYYDPTIGRYITSDPIGLAAELNTYGYALQNPIRFTDRRGLLLDFSPEFDDLVSAVRATEAGNRIVDTLENSKFVYRIRTPFFGACKAEFNVTANGGKIVMNPSMKAWVNTTNGGFALVRSDRILFHELVHAFLRDQRQGPVYDPSNRNRPFTDLVAEEEQFVIDNYGNKFGDGIDRLNHEKACPVSQCN